MKARTAKITSNSLAFESKKLKINALGNDENDDRNGGGSFPNINRQTLHLILDLFVEDHESIIRSNRRDPPPKSGPNFSKNNVNLAGK